MEVSVAASSKEYTGSSRSNEGQIIIARTGRIPTSRPWIYRIWNTATVEPADHAVGSHRTVVFLETYWT